MQVIAQDALRDLNKDEINFIRKFFSKANVDNMKYLGEKGKLVKTSDLHLDKLCNIYSCLDKGSSTEVYFSSNGSYIENIGPKFKNEICIKPEYKCIDFNVFYVTYNCIGWALGISKWLNPSKITDYIQHKGLTRQQALEKFITSVVKEYPGDHISNLENIVDKISLKKNMIYPANNTIGFYFKWDECLHGSRFVNTVTDKALNQWTSKLGQEFLVSHDDDDLLYDGSPYGNAAYYFGISYNINENEL